MDLRDIHFKLYTVLLLALQIVLFFALGRSGVVKYLFAIAVAGMIFAFMNKKDNCIDKLYFFVPWLVYIVIGLLLCIYQESFNALSIKQSLFYLSPLMMAFVISIFCKNYMKELVDVQFWAIVIVFLQWGIQHFTRVNLMESQYAFIFGAYLIYYLYYKRFILTGFSFVMLYLADKRIGMLAAVLVACWFVFLWFFKKEKHKLFLSNVLYTVVIAVMFGYIYIIKEDILLRFTSKYKINTMGRANVYSMMSPLYELSPDYIGSGIGTVKNAVENLGISSYQLLHNDVLSFYIELGFIGFLIFWLMYWLLLRRLSKRLSVSQFVIVAGLFVYTFLLLTTDNISIYINYFYPFYMMIFAAMEDKTQSERRKCHG